MYKRSVDFISYVSLVVMLLTLVCSMIVGVILSVFFEGYTSLETSIRLSYMYFIPVGLMVGVVNWKYRIAHIHVSNIIILDMFLGAFIWYIFAR